MSSNVKVLCETHGELVCCRLDHRGKGSIWVDSSEPGYSTPLLMIQVVTFVMGSIVTGASLIGDKISLVMLVSGVILVGWNFVIFMFGRNLYEKAGWNVNVRRTIFRIPITKAIERSLKYINKLHRKVEKEKEKELEIKDQDRQAELLVAHLKEILRELPL